MKKILILTAGFGDGHNAAARNIRDALEIISEDVRVEVLDLFESSYGAWNTFARKCYLGMAQHAPWLWGNISSVLNRAPGVERTVGGYERLKEALGDVLHVTQPDCVVSTYPGYAGVIEDLFRDHAEKNFTFITIVTDSIPVHSTWYRSPSDRYVVANEATARVLREQQVPAEKILSLGFPVSPRFAGANRPAVTPPGTGMKRKVLYIVNTGRKKTGRGIERLLEIPCVDLTITVGRDAELKSKLAERTQFYGSRVKILGWTNQMPELMMSHHLIVGKAGGAVVQEAIAARCPILINQVIPGQEEGNAQLVERYGLGAVVEKNKEVAEAVEEAFAHDARQWRKWGKNLDVVSKPDAAMRIAEMILNEAESNHPRPNKIHLFPSATVTSVSERPTQEAGSARMLLCDFHTHTNYSDGKLTVAELVDLYGKMGFDCVCITDHLADPRRLIGKLARLSNLTLSPDQLGEYFEVIAREAARAWRKYGMIVMAGIEFNKDGYSKKTSAHLLGIDLKGPVSAALDLKETIAMIHAQRGLAVASHPHIMKSEWGKNTLYLWDHHEEFAPLLDAWEIANRNDIFSPIGLKKFPFLANSDFHKPKHIYSWKTLLHCEKNAEAIKECIRKNEHVSITLFRDSTRKDLRELKPEKVLEPWNSPGNKLIPALRSIPA